MKCVQMGKDNQTRLFRPLRRVPSKTTRSTTLESYQIDTIRQQDILTRKICNKISRVNDTSIPRTSFNVFLANF